MLDTINMERKGVPAAAIGVEKLAMTTGIGMARAQGFPHLRIAMLAHTMGIMVGHHDSTFIDMQAKQLTEQVERILLKA